MNSDLFNISWALLRDGRNAKREFRVLQEGQGLTERLNYLNQKVITAINTLDDSTLGDNLIMSQQVHDISAALIPAENVENNQEHFVANKVVVLCITSLSLRNHSYA